MRLAAEADRMSYFSRPKFNPKPADVAGPPAAADVAPAKIDTMPTFGHAMAITGHIVCTGGLQSYGHVSAQGSIARQKALCSTPLSPSNCA